MADGTKIEWADATWSPLIGCTKVSSGCDNCYAEGVVDRFAGTGEAWPARFDTVSIRPVRFLTLPLTWVKPRKVFVNSLSDLFHKDVPDEFIGLVFAVMAATPRHTFQLLTKRHGRMRALLGSRDFREVVLPAALRTLTRAVPHATIPEQVEWPLRNVWLGVSVEDQKHADLRIPALLGTPAAVRWISAEPLLGPVNLAHRVNPARPAMQLPGYLSTVYDQGSGKAVQPPLDWVVVGGESGPNARPMHPEWARQIRDACVLRDVPFLFKQHGSWVSYASRDDRWGGRNPDAWVNVATGDVARDEEDPRTRTGSWAGVWKVNKHDAGRLLDGRTYDGYPEMAHA